MKTRQLGKDGFEVGEMGIGLWQLGGADWGPIDDQRAEAILSAARDSGTTFFDTANVYGNGRSEELLGRWMKEREAPVVVASKYGRGEVYPDGYSKEDLVAAVTASARRLGVDCIDLIQLHCVPTEVLRDGQIFQWLREIRDDGLIRHFGASVESVEEGLICLEVEDLLSLQVIFNPFRQKLVDELLPQAKAAGVGVIVRVPLASGLLAGKFSAATEFPAADHRNYNRDGQCFNAGETFAGLPFGEGVALVEELKGQLPAGLTMAQMTQRWILDHEAVSVIIPGASSPEQARENAAVSDLAPLSPELHSFLADFYEERVKHLIRGAY